MAMTIHGHEVIPLIVFGIPVNMVDHVRHLPLTLALIAFAHRVSVELHLA